MSGETKTSVSAWTIDSAKEYLESRLDKLAHELDRRFDAVDRRLDERVDSVQELMVSADTRYSQRHEAIKDALGAADLRYAQRYEASQTAIKDALAAQEKGTMAQLIAAKEAVVKAEIAGDKRFEGMNEFRGQLRDQAGTFIDRKEAGARFDAQNDKYDQLLARHTAFEKRFAEAMAGMGGRSGGVSQTWGTIATMISILIAGASIVIVLVRG